MVVQGLTTSISEWKSSEITTWLRYVGLGSHTAQFEKLLLSGSHLLALASNGESIKVRRCC